MYDKNDRDDRNDRSNINNRNDLNNRSGRGNGLIYFAVGALIIAVIGIGFMAAQGPQDADFTVMEPAAGDQGGMRGFETRPNETGFQPRTDETGSDTGFRPYGGDTEEGRQRYRE